MAVYNCTAYPKNRLKKPIGDVKHLEIKPDTLNQEVTLVIGTPSDTGMSWSASIPLKDGTECSVDKWKELSCILKG